MTSDNLMKPVKIGILGLGTVGGGTASVLERNSAEISRRAGREIELVAASVRDINKKRSDTLKHVKLTLDSNEIVDNPDIDIILECDVSPQQVAELAVEAEKLGIRALWSSNYHQNYDCFMTLMPAAAATSKILLGPLAVSPWELHPLKMANALLTLNEYSNGRGMVAISGGGGVLGAVECER